MYPLICWAFGCTNELSRERRAPFGVMFNKYVIQNKLINFLKKQLS